MPHLPSLTALLVLAAVGSALAQGQAVDRPCTAPGASASAGAQHCTGPGRHARWGRNDTPGWRMMTPDERQEHRRQMSSFSSYEECTAYARRHHEEMEARAKEKGRVMPAQPGRDACAPLKRDGAG